jgi:hypothetical protein
MRLLGWAIIQYEWWPYNKRWLGHRQTYREDHVRTREDAIYKPRSGLRGNQPSWHLDLRLLASITMRN